MLDQRKKYLDTIIEVLLNLNDEEIEYVTYYVQSKMEDIFEKALEEMEANAS